MPIFSAKIFLKSSHRSQVDPKDIPSRNQMKNKKWFLDDWIKGKKNAGYDSLQHNR
jgi:hypothetical protein